MAIPVDKELEKIELLFNNLSHDSNQYVALQMLASNGYSCEDLAKYILRDFNLIRVGRYFHNTNPNARIIYQIGKKRVTLIFLVSYKIIHESIRGSHVSKVEFDDAEEKLYEKLVILISIGILIQKLYI